MSAERPPGSHRHGGRGRCLGVRDQVHRRVWFVWFAPSLSLSPELAMASNLLAMASDLRAMASTGAMASNLLVMASNPSSDGLQPNRDGLQPLFCPNLRFRYSGLPLPVAPPCSGSPPTMLFVSRFAPGFLDCLDTCPCEATTNFNSLSFQETLSSRGSTQILGVHNKSCTTLQRPEKLRSVNALQTQAETWLSKPFCLHSFPQICMLCMHVLDKLYMVEWALEYLGHVGNQDVAPPVRAPHLQMVRHCKDGELM